MSKKPILYKTLVVGVIVLFLNIIVIPSSGNIFNDISSSIPIFGKRIIYVDDDNTEGPWDGTEEHPFIRIKQGLEVARDGDIIYVFNGTYFTNGLNIYDKITIQGEDSLSTIVDGQGKGRIIDIRKSYVTITGFTFRNAERAIRIYDDHATIENNIICSCSIGGIRIESSSYSKFINNLFHDNPRGIYGEMHANHLIINGNTFEYCSDTGINLEISRYNLIIQNSFLKNNRGLYLTRAEGNKIIKNNFIDNNKDARFRFGIDYDRRCIWLLNYWDDWFRFFIPRPIIGFLWYHDVLDHEKSIKWVNFDWLPSPIPHKIFVNSYV